jgi:RNA polymerase sigma-70 factor, ECF subfamily
MAKDGSRAAILDTAKLKSLEESARGDYDSELMLQLRAGVRDAGEKLAERNCARIARFITRVVRDPRAVEDLTQDVFLQVFKNSSRYEPTARFSTWLFRIATNVSINYVHKSARRRRQLRQALENPPPAAHGAPDSELGIDEIRARVSAAMGRLPVNQRLAVTLFNLDGFSYEQTSIIMACTQEAVRGLLMRARATLRDELRDLITN